MNTMDGVVICSFYTGDDYYRTSADALRSDLDRLGLRSVIEEIEKPDGTDWADICRKKIPFVARVCESHPNDRVFWIDVDCRLLDIPDYVRNSTADLLGFQRGFGSPLTIGYGRRTRFWEPTFLGINSTPGGRAFIAEAARQEASSEAKATDDYFFEEAWRAKADNLTFQILPSPAIVGRGTPDGTVSPFFVFGSSGNVAEFKGKVAQHAAHPVMPRRPTARSLAGVARRQALRGAKIVHGWMPERASGTLRRVADRSGVTHLLTGGAENHSSASNPSAHRSGLSKSMVMAGQRGEPDRVAAIYERLTAAEPPTAPERTAHAAALSFSHFTHVGVPLTLPDNVDELSVLVSTPHDIAGLVRRLNEYDYVITSAMHVLIACHSYGIPAGLVTFAGLEAAVHGSGMKYTDYARGVGIADELTPQVVGFNLKNLSLESLVSDVTIRPEVLDDVEDAVREAHSRYVDMVESRTGV